MDGEEGGGIRLSKRFSDKGGEVDYKTKAGTAWSHSYLNQKPWHPLSYPNQRRKWIAEQTHAQCQRRAEEVAREYAQEQDFFRQTALISEKEKEKVELMQAVSFMYVRPPGYNAESAKAAEMADDKKKEELSNRSQVPIADGPSSMPPEEKKKPRPKDVFGRPLPTEEEFEILKNAPRLDTGVHARVKPFGVEVRNVKCLRCGNYGHQSGDRECPLKDAIMPSEESRLKRDDPLNAILAHTDPNEPLKWELKQRPGMSPPRGGFKADDPNQQIVAEDIFDEYGGFLSGGLVPELLTNFSQKSKQSKKKKHKRKQPLYAENESSSDDGERRSKKKRLKAKKKKLDHSKSTQSHTSDSDNHQRKSREKHSQSSEDSDRDRDVLIRKTRPKHSHFPTGSDHPGHDRSKRTRQKPSYSSEDSGPLGYHGRHRSIDGSSYSSEDSGNDRNDGNRKNRQKHTFPPRGSAHCRSKHSRKRHGYSSEDSGPDGYHGIHKGRDKLSCSSEDLGSDRDDRSRKPRQKHLHSPIGSNRPGHDRTRRKRHSHSYQDSDHDVSRGRHESRDGHSYSSESEDSYHHRQPSIKGSSHKRSSKAHVNSHKHRKSYESRHMRSDTHSLEKAFPEGCQNSELSHQRGGRHRHRHSDSD